MSGLLNKHESMLKNYRLEGEESDEDEHVNRSNKKASRTQAASSTSKPTQAMDRNDDYQDDDDSDEDEKDISPNAGTGSKNTDAASTRKVNDCKIFVGNLPFTALKQDLEILFSQFGVIIGVNLRMDRLTNKPKGFAFVTFDNSDSADLAVQQMNGFSMQGRPLTVSMADVRGSKKAEEDANAVWKTVPTASKKDKLNKQGKTPKATWDHWTGPQGPTVKKDASTTSKSGKDGKKK